MPIRPTAADIAAYNAWARRNGEAPHGADDGANAQAPAAAAGRSPIAAAVVRGTRARLNGRPPHFRWELRLDGRTVVLTNPDGSLTAQGHQYSRAARALGLPNFELNLWRTGVHVLNGSNSDVAYDMNGQMRFVRRFNAATGRYEVLGDVGRSYFRTHRSRFNAAIPVKRLVRKEVPPGSGNWQYVETNNGDVYKYITDEQIQDFLMGAPGVNLADLMVAPAEATPDQQRDWISEAVHAYLQQMPRIGSGQWHQLTEFDDSSCIYVWDPQGQLRFDEEISHVRDDGDLAIQTILNRPLRGIGRTRCTAKSASIPWPGRKRCQEKTASSTCCCSASRSARTLASGTGEPSTARR